MQLIDAAAASLALALACGLAASQRQEERDLGEARRCAWQLAQLSAGALRWAEAHRDGLAADAAPCRRLQGRELQASGALPFEIAPATGFGQPLEVHACLKEGRAFGIALAKGLPRGPEGGPPAGAGAAGRLYRAYSLPAARALACGLALPPEGMPAYGSLPLGQARSADAQTQAGPIRPPDMASFFGLPDPGPGTVFAASAGAPAGGDADYLRRVRSPGLEDRTAMAAPLSLEGHAAAGLGGLGLAPLGEGRLLAEGRPAARASAFAQACRESQASAAGALGSLDGRLAFASPEADGAQDAQDGQNGQAAGGAPGVLLACLNSRPRTLASTPERLILRDARPAAQGELVPKPWCPRGSRPRLDLIQAASPGSFGSAPGTHVLTQIDASADGGSMRVAVTPAAADSRIEGFRASAEEADGAWRVRLERRRTVSSSSLSNWEPLADWMGASCRECTVSDASWEEDPDARALALVSCVPDAAARDADLAAAPAAPAQGRPRPDAGPRLAER